MFSMQVKKNMLILKLSWNKHISINQFLTAIVISYFLRNTNLNSDYDKYIYVGY